MALPTRRAAAGPSVFAFLRRHQVVLTSPHPPAECGSRLEAATGRTAPFSGFRRLPLQGRVSPAQIRVGLRPSQSNRNSLRAYFTGRIEQAPDGGTEVVGTIGPHSSAPVVFAWIAVVWLLIGGGMFAAGLSTLVSGHPELPLLLFPAAFAVAFGALLVTGPGMARKEIQMLLDELNAILDSTAAFPGAAQDPPA